MSMLITNIGELVTNAPQPSGSAGAIGPAGAIGAAGATGAAGTGQPARSSGAESAGFAALSDAALVIDDGRVAWTGRAAEAPAADELVDAAGRVVLPGFVDSHAHLVFAGERGAEFAARMAGVPYSAGGIRSTVSATRGGTG